MARGWESKSVEAQQAEAGQNLDQKGERLTPEQIVKKKQLEGLVLSRSNVAHQLEAAHDPRHRRMLEDALAELDRRIKALKASA
jgi:hypothetical protein